MQHAEADWKNKLGSIKPLVTKTLPEQDPAVDLGSGEMTVCNGASQEVIKMSKTDHAEFIKNAKELQRVAIWEKRFAMLANAGMVILAAVTASGAAYGVYKSAQGKTTSNPV